MNLVSLLHQRAAEHPERAALVDRAGGRDRTMTYGELGGKVMEGAAGFAKLGLKRGDHILVFQPVSIELYVCLLSAFHAGIRVMLADPSAGREFLKNCCSRVPPDAYFGPWKAMALRLAVPCLRKIPLAISSGIRFPGARSWSFTEGKSKLVDLPDDEPALVTFTSGSTGIPKAAQRTHGFLLAQHRSLSRALEFEDGEVDLITLPVFVLANLASGLTSVLAATDLAKPGSPDATAILAQCERHRVTRCAASPAFFEGLLASRNGLPAFRKIFTGGAPVFNDLLARLSAARPQALVHSVYGSTEAEPIAHFPAEELVTEISEVTAKGGGLCAGESVPEIELRIIREQWGRPLGPLDESDFAETAVPPGEAGEIVVSGDHVLAGYLEGKGDGETKIKVGDIVWHRTGDAGKIDDEGRLWLLGRASERLSDGTYPFAIECAMRAAYPGKRFAVLEWKGGPTLVVEGTPHRDLETKAASLGVRQVISLKAIPLDKRHNAKIDYPGLRKALGG